MLLNRHKAQPLGCQNTIPGASSQVEQINCLPSFGGRIFRFLDALDISLQFVFTAQAVP